MDLKWLPNTLTVLRCGLAFVVGWSILNLSLTLEFLPDALSAQDAIAAARLQDENVPGLVELADFDRSALWMPFVLFVIVAGTDFLDGYLARKLDAATPFGAFLDPLADKLLVGVSLLGICLVNDWGVFWLLPAIAIIARDAFVTGLRVVRPQVRAVSRFAKWKTALEMVAIGLFLFGFALPELAASFFGNDLDRWLQDLAPARSALNIVSTGLIYLAAFAALITGYHYLRAALSKSAS